METRVVTHMQNQVKLLAATQDPAARSYAPLLHLRAVPVRLQSQPESATVARLAPETPAEVGVGKQAGEEVVLEPRKEESTEEGREGVTVLEVVELWEVSLRPRPWTTYLPDLLTMRQPASHLTSTFW